MTKHGHTILYHIGDQADPLLATDMGSICQKDKTCYRSTELFGSPGSNHDQSNSPVKVTLVLSQSYKSKTREEPSSNSYNLKRNIPDEYLPSSQQGETYGLSPFNEKNRTLRKFKTSPSDENRRPDGWVGGFSPMGDKPRRSWKVKAIRDAIPQPNLDS